MSSNKYQSENNPVESVILFVIFFALFCGGIFAMAFWSLEDSAHAFIPGIVGIGLCFLSLVIPMTWIGRSNSAGEQ